MFRRVRETARHPLVKNMGALFSIQGLSLILPLITFPYLVRHLGLENYGLMNLAMAVSGYLQIFVDYGFGITGTREASIHRNDPEGLSEIVVGIFGLKVLMAVIALPVLAAFIWLTPEYRPHFGLFMLACLGAFGSSMTPTWLLQGLETMGPLAKVSIGAKILNVGLLVLFVHQPSDINRALFIGAMATCLPALLFLPKALFHAKGGLQRTTSRRLKAFVVDGASIFFSQIGLLLFNNTNMVILSFHSTPQQLGSYAIADKLVRAAIGLTGPVSWAVFPRVSHLMSQSKESAFAFIRKVAPPAMAVFGSLSICMFLFVDITLKTLFKQTNPDAVTLVRILSILPLSIYLDNIYGTQILLTNHLEKPFMACVLGSGIASVCIQLLLIPHFSIFGAAGSWLASQLLLLGLFIGVAKHRGLQLTTRWWF